MAIKIILTQRKTCTISKLYSIILAKIPLLFRNNHWKNSTKYNHHVLDCLLKKEVRPACIIETVKTPTSWGIRCDRKVLRKSGSLRIWIKLGMIVRIQSLLISIKRLIDTNSSKNFFRKFLQEFYKE